MPPPIPHKDVSSPIKSKTKGSSSIASRNYGANAKKYYLIVYNVLSTLGWSYILVRLLLHLSGLTASAPPPSSRATQTASTLLSRFFTSVPLPLLRSTSRSAGYKAALGKYVHAPKWLQVWLTTLYGRAETTYGAVGPTTAFVQTFALLEVMHAALGWVRSPVQTTAMQVASRLYLVWGVVEQFDSARTSPLYASMVFAWSLTEVIRYSFYALSLLSYEPSFLLYLRYTTFYVLYPLGAGSEAFVNYATLPASSPLPTPSSWARGMWGVMDYIRGALFLIWWPGLYVMYTYMIKQRKKVLGTGPGYRIGAKPKTR
ncbi:PTPLA-domain-containing protein [Rickenella mellea]|uniref:Very-long-chain (3R)-3-hydroxyacyl-CoA dehydratase n=1 Tax=Rickenella mellea TaxID=50990 RepID=A0A4Y7QGK5_9AGAM|nr:PTPLA-domain-containing protein [Rickenella mellea]